MLNACRSSSLESTVTQARWAEAARRRRENMTEEQRAAQKNKWAEAARRRYEREGGREYKRKELLTEQQRAAQKAKWAEAARRRSAPRPLIAYSFCSWGQHALFLTFLSLSHFFLSFSLSLCIFFSNLCI